MAAGGDRKNKRRIRTVAFTVAELLIACAIFMTAGGGVMLVASGVVARFDIFCSDYSVEREAEAASAWIAGQLHRARMFREDVKIFTPSSKQPLPDISAIRIRALPDLKPEKWVGEKIAFTVFNSSGPREQPNHTYKYMFQTMSPAFYLDVHRLKGDSYEKTGWKIVVSGSGLTRLVK
jgi:hypothetical protein